MKRAAFLGVTAAASLVLTAAVIITAGYYTGMALLPGQIAMIALPVWTPFVILSSTRSGMRWWPVPAAIVGASWAWVVYIDTRPYIGGGASFAVLWGWLGCVVASLSAFVPLVARGG